MNSYLSPSSRGGSQHSTHKEGASTYHNRHEALDSHLLPFALGVQRVSAGTAELSTVTSSPKLVSSTVLAGEGGGGRDGGGGIQLPIQRPGPSDSHTVVPPYTTLPSSTPSFTPQPQAECFNCEAVVKECDATQQTLLAEIAALRAKLEEKDLLIAGLKREQQRSFHFNRANSGGSGHATGSSSSSFPICDDIDRSSQRETWATRRRSPDRGDGLTSTAPMIVPSFPLKGDTAPIGPEATGASKLFSPPITVVHLDVPSSSWNPPLRMQNHNHPVGQLTTGGGVNSPTTGRPMSPSREEDDTSYKAPTTPMITGVPSTPSSTPSSSSLHGTTRSYGKIISPPAAAAAAPEAVTTAVTAATSRSAVPNPTVLERRQWPKSYYEQAHTQ